MENYIMFKGVRIPIADEQIEELAHCDTISLSMKKIDPFKRIQNTSYYAISSGGQVLMTEDIGYQRDNLHYSIGNYCRDEQILQQRALHETLSRLLWRFSMENGEDKNPWDGDSWHYAIYSTYSTDDEIEFCTYCAKYNEFQGVVYFPSTEIAKQAISEIVMPFIKEHPDFVW